MARALQTGRSQNADAEFKGRKEMEGAQAGASPGDSERGLGLGVRVWVLAGRPADYVTLYKWLSLSMRGLSFSSVGWR